jgi:hypothetical protein
MEKIFSVEETLMQERDLSANDSRNIFSTMGDTHKETFLVTLLILLYKWKRDFQGSFLARM